MLCCLDILENIQYRFQAMAAKIEGACIEALGINQTNLNFKFFYVSILSIFAGFLLVGRYGEKAGY